jgi:membrane associated rhomboid family serine protease
VISLLVVLGVFAAVWYYVATPEERSRVIQRADPAVRLIQQWLAQTAPLRLALRERRRWLIATPALLIVNLVVYVCALFSGHALTESERLIAWGAADGLRMGAGEWWRLFTATLVHAGLFELLVTVVGVWQVASLLERLIGRVSVCCVYFGAGALGHAFAISIDVTGVQAGGLPAIVGLSGMLLVSFAWRRLRRAEPAMPIAVFKLLAPSAALLLLGTMVRHEPLGVRNLAPLAAGILIGFAATMSAHQTKRRFAPVAVATTAVTVLVVYVAAPVQGSVSVRSQLSAIVALESRTAESYDQALRRFTDQRVPIVPDALASIIERTILPQLSVAASEVTAIETLATDHDSLVATAADYLRLRKASWEVRAEGLRKGSMPRLQEADRLEQSARRALEPLKREFSSTESASS